MKVKVVLRWIFSPSTKVLSPSDLFSSVVLSLISLFLSACQLFLSLCWKASPRYRFCVLPEFLSSVFSYMHADNEPTVRSWTAPHSHTVHFTERLVMPPFDWSNLSPGHCGACPVATGNMCSSQLRETHTLRLREKQPGQIWIKKIVTTNQWLNINQSPFEIRSKFSVCF